MSNILTNNINPRSGNLITIGGANDKVSIGGTLSYEDVTNIDSVGIITAQQGLDTPTDLVLRTGGSEQMRIDSSGRLLIGTSSSSATVTTLLQGNSSGATSWGALNLARGNTSPNSGQSLGEVSFSDSGHDIAGLIACQRDGGTWTTGVSQPTTLLFSTTADGSPNNSYYLNVKYSPGNRGCVYLENFAFYSSQHALVINDLDTNNARTMSDVRFERNGTEVGFIKINPSSVTYSTTSDYRLKENVIPLTNAIERLNQLQVHRFNFISYPESTVDGFIAHEAQTVVPEAVSGYRDETKDLGDITDASGNIIASAVDNPLPEHLEDGHTWNKTHTIDVHQGIDQSKLVPLLTASLQEAIAKIETLEQRLTDAGL